MKKILFPALLSLVVSRADAQATLEHEYTFTSTRSEVVLFSSNGEKIMNYDSTQVRLYNMNHTLWKSIPIPPIASFGLYRVYTVTDKLFNSDNAVECVVTYSNRIPGSYPRYRTQLISESGSVLQAIDTSYWGEVHYNEVDDNYKLFTLNLVPMSSAIGYHTKVYSLPGTLPCGKCGTMGTEKVSGTAGSYIGVSDPRPNPSAGMTRIDYLLPMGITDAELVVYSVSGDIVQRQQLAPQATFVYLDNSSFVPGVYTYVIRSGAASSEVKKLLVK